MGFIVFQNGFLIHITMDVHSVDVVDILIDKTLEGKLIADVASGISNHTFMHLFIYFIYKEL